MVKCGIDRISEYRRLFKGMRVGLITSPSGVNSEFRPTADIIAQNCNLTALFAPEHGIRGDREAGAEIGSYIDEKTGTAVYSLYRADSRHMTEEMLKSVDMVVYDIADVGARYYTFISTMFYVMQDCAKNGKAFVVLDRPNPLGGTAVEGGRLKPEFSSFVGALEIPVRYGLTPGELAMMINDRYELKCSLTVITCEGWDRETLFPQTGGSWMPPSPNMPRFETALVYPGTCLLEGTNMSEGRGTASPFEMVGADYIDGAELADELNSRGLPGVKFTAAYFTPCSSKYTGMMCGGVYFHITDIEEYQSVRAGIELLDAVKGLYPESFEWLKPPHEGGRPFISLLSGNDYLVSGMAKEDIIIDYASDAMEFSFDKLKYHIY